MKDSLQPVSRFGVGKNTPGKFIAAQPTIGPDNFCAEQPLHLGKRGLSWFHDLAGDDVGIDHRQATFAQQIRGRRFAHADCPGQSESFHGREYCSVNSEGVARFRFRKDD